ncbi:hypothetical protein C7974DRAFT_113330 [Boeremia exigua]|uniref:uncharacterized protein n=1 Tax=Boeremia exigua TaxID=749465 RepID=UPI001E8CF334|nr:uncharacterized protein C7974DRAFT_113330 [Boeremia exigua]KAH6642959.1 hypothetical protein C7974DRAFT_113330 [Boeremia exigua]
MLLLCFFSYFVRGAFSATAVVEVAWHSAPNERGTWDLIVSCVLTLMICVWSALHLNVPTTQSRLMDRNVRRLRWILLGIFAPEVVVSTAFAQYLTARWLMNEIREDIKYRNNPADEATNEKQPGEWTMTQCYFAVMGGIVIEPGNYIDNNDHSRAQDHGRPDELSTASRPLSITAEGARLLSFLNRLPDVRDTQVRDKSKADGLAKFLVVVQAGWMIIQCIARVQQDLPVTLLEINTIGHVICAFALYMLWWNKPLDIKDPYIIKRNAELDPCIALMWMCSPISGDKVDEISEIRCLAYKTPGQRSNASPTIPTTHLKVDSTKPVEISLSKTHRTRLSVGSVGARDPRKFIGPLHEMQVGAEHHQSSFTPFDHDLSYVYQCERVATEHEVFFSLQGHTHGLQHTRNYCRRGFSDCTNHDPLSINSIERWKLANKVIDELYEESKRRPNYDNFFFTDSSLGLFVGEPIYVGDHIPNFPGFSFLGSVNVQRDRLKTVVAFAGAAYGGLHLAAWNDYFPTSVERIMWISCSCATGLTGLVLALFFLATNQLPQLEAAESHVRNSKKFRIFWKWILIPLFMTARVFIVAEAFICLRRQPEAIYSTPEWSNYFPHL